VQFGAADLYWAGRVRGNGTFHPDHSVGANHRALSSNSLRGGSGVAPNGVRFVYGGRSYFAWAYASRSRLRARGLHRHDQPDRTTGKAYALAVGAISVNRQPLAVSFAASGFPVRPSWRSALRWIRECRLSGKGPNHPTLPTALLG
jgi:hypothetical protein